MSALDDMMALMAPQGQQVQTPQDLQAMKNMRVQQWVNQHQMNQPGVDFWSGFQAPNPMNTNTATGQDPRVQMLINALMGK